eukprot:m.13714 g.13714  ORF g.13714 m.13714 type:complete len:581 (-) comp10211_c0_seq1:271-2013(-)
MAESLKQSLFTPVINSQLLRDCNKLCIALVPAADRCRALGHSVSQPHEGSLLKTYTDVTELISSLPQLFSAAHLQLRRMDDPGLDKGLRKAIGTLCAITGSRDAILPALLCNAGLEQPLLDLCILDRGCSHDATALCMILAHFDFSVRHNVLAFFAAHLDATPLTSQFDSTEFNYRVMRLPCRLCFQDLQQVLESDPTFSFIQRRTVDFTHSEHRHEATLPDTCPLQPNACTLRSVARKRVPHQVSSTLDEEATAVETLFQLPYPQHATKKHHLASPPSTSFEVLLRAKTKVEQPPAVMFSDDSIHPATRSLLFSSDMSFTELPTFDGNSDFGKLTTSAQCEYLIQCYHHHAADPSAAALLVDSIKSLCETLPTPISVPCVDCAAAFADAIPYLTPNKMRFPRGANFNHNISISSLEMALQPGQLRLSQNAELLLDGLRCTVGSLSERLQIHPLVFEQDNVIIPIQWWETDREVLMKLDDGAPSTFRAQQAANEPLVSIEIATNGSPAACLLLLSLLQKRLSRNCHSVGYLGDNNFSAECQSELMAGFYSCHHYCFAPKCSVGDGRQARLLIVVSHAPTE